jgi:hypothetical protein
VRRDYVALFVQQATIGGLLGDAVDVVDKFMYPGLGFLQCIFVRLIQYQRVRTID